MHYLNIIHILHLEWDLPDPLLDNFRLRCVMQGIRRDVGDFVCRKLPMTPCLLRQVLSQLDLSRPLDLLVWAACLVLFYTTLRRSNLLPSHLLQFVTPAVISIGLISRFTPEESAWGLIGVKLINSNKQTHTRCEDIICSAVQLSLYEQRLVTVDQIWNTPTSKTLGCRCVNIIQIFCVNWVTAALY